VDLIAAGPWYPAIGSTVGLFMELVAAPHVEEFGGLAAPWPTWHIDIAGQWRELPVQVVAELRMTAPPTFTSAETLNVPALNAAVERAAARTAAAPR